MRFCRKTGENILRDNKINRIYLMLGSACNFHCKYCLQCDMKPNSNKHMSDKLKKYLWKLVAYKMQSTPIRIMFWGGEPLLYFEQIKEIVKIYKNNFAYTIISNGSLLTKEKVDFINNNKITFILSHDGKYTTKTRFTDVLQNPVILALINQIDNLAVDATTSSFNMDYDMLLDYWNIVLPKAVPNIELLRVTWDMPEELYRFDLNKYRENTEIFLNKAIDDLISGNVTKRVLVALPFFNLVADGLDGKKKLINCGQTYHNLNVDLDGNIYACHNTGIIIGSVTDNRDTYIKAYKKWLNSKRLRACNDCSVKNYCNGGCPLEPKDKNGYRKTCQINKVFFECVEKAVKRIIEFYKNSPGLEVGNQIMR